MWQFYIFLENFSFSSLPSLIDRKMREEKAWLSCCDASFRWSSRGRINARQIKPEFLHRCGTLNRFVNSGAACSSECKTPRQSIAAYYTILPSPWYIGTVWFRRRLNFAADKAKVTSLVMQKKNIRKIAKAWKVFTSVSLAENHLLNMQRAPLNFRFSILDAPYNKDGFLFISHHNV